jgi:hypothetical protein
MALAATVVPIIVLSVTSSVLPGDLKFGLWFSALALLGIATVTAIVLAVAGKKQIGQAIAVGCFIGIVAMGVSCFANLVAWSA